MNGKTKLLVAVCLLTLGLMAIGFAVSRRGDSVTETDAEDGSEGDADARTTGRVEA
ncbi:hypothetical protein [Halegenticoccus tardaugens]|uniref:hypothetical protein n=1 Tax=Halegenticoccus tardaugens TaxID=2071624 RepID=UPI0013E94D59|nr:hypothetical protein [Halegenticoccus tardaugens]